MRARSGSPSACVQRTMATTAGRACPSAAWTLSPRVSVTSCTPSYWAAISRVISADGSSCAWKYSMAIESESTWLSSCRTWRECPSIRSRMRSDSDMASDL